MTKLLIVFIFMIATLCGIRRATAQSERIGSMSASSITGVLPVTNGGTGSGSLLSNGGLVFGNISGLYTQDSSNLFYDSINKRVGIGTTTPLTALQVSGPVMASSVMACSWNSQNVSMNLSSCTDAMSLPSGNTAQRPTATAGSVRWNTDTIGIEVANGTSWAPFATVALTGSYSDLINKPTIPSAQVNSDWNSVSGVSQILNKPNLSRSFSYPSRALNGCFQPSITQDTDFNYSIDVTAAITLGGGTGVATSYTNSGCTTGAQAMANGSVSSVALLGTSSIPLHGILPAGKWMKVTSSATGGGSSSIDAVQAETLLP